MEYTDFFHVALYRKAAGRLLAHIRKKYLRPQYRSKKYSCWKIQELAEKLLKNGYFDSDYYCRRHPGIRHSGVEPAEHFLLYGWEKHYRFSKKPVPPEFRHFLSVICGESDYQANPEYLAAISDQFCAVLRRLIDQNQLEKLGLIYDDQYYKKMNQDVCSMYPVAFQHYVDIGWQEQRNGSEHCSVAAYLNYMAKQGIPVKCNPLFHFIEQGADFDLLKRIVTQERYKTRLGCQSGPPEFAQFLATICNEPDCQALPEYQSVISDQFCATLRRLIDQNQLEKLRLLYDDQYYRKMNPDLNSKYPVAFRHYAEIGWQELRNGSEHCTVTAYLSYMDKRNKPVYCNPLFHFIEQGADFDLLKRIAKEKCKKSKTGKPQVLGEFVQFMTTICGEPDYRALPGYRAVLSEKFCATLRRLIKQNKLETLRLIYDDQYYRQTNQDLGSKYSVAFRHYVEIGWQENRNGSEHFSGKTYLNYMVQQNIPVKCNPLFHFIEQGADFDLLKRMTEERKKSIFNGQSVPPEFVQFMATICGEPDCRALPEYLEEISEDFCATLRRLIKQNRLGNLKFIYHDLYYKRSNPDLREDFQIPFRHYAKFGWKEQRNGSEHCSTVAYINYMAKQAKPVNCNPLFHFIEQGADFDLLKRIAAEGGKYSCLGGRLVPPEFEQFLTTVCGERDCRALSVYQAAISENFCTTLRRLIKQNRLETLKFFFNGLYYKRLYPDVKAAFSIPFRHYAEYGWLEQRNGSEHCSTAAYISYMEKQNIPVKCNPLFHFIEQGADFDLLPWIALEDYEGNIRQKKYFAKYVDPDLYWAENPDVYNYFLDPVSHFENDGYREFRNPGPHFNLSEYQFFLKSQGKTVKGNPLADFAKRNGSDELLIEAHNQFRQAFDQGMKKLSVTQMYLSEVNLPATQSEEVPGKTAVHLHLFYYDLLPEILHYLDHIPWKFDLFISLPSASKVRITDLQKRVKYNLARLNKLTIVRTPNRGRDWAPLIVTFGKELVQYDYICHIHTKKSLHGKRATAQWRNHIMDLLLGSSAAVKKILHLLADGTAKIIYPAPLPEIHNSDIGWDENFDIAQDLAKRYWNQDLSEFSVIDFSKGSMFWARSAAVEKLLKLPLAYEDFPPEPIPTDGTLAHALERLLLIAAVETPGKCVCLRSPSDGRDKNGFRIPAQVTKPFWNRLPAPVFPYILNIASPALLNIFQDRHKVQPCPDTDIIIPVFNGPEHLRRLLASLAKNTAPQHRIILVDDASWEPETQSLLNKFCAERRGTVLIRNKRNLGFLPTVNLAASFCQHDFVLLNMDTEVPEHWLERLMAPLSASEDIASVTPISNAATICSFPEKDTNNRDWAKLFGTEEIDRVFRMMKLPHSCDIPVGVGFCMAVRKKVWDEIGPFDASSFGRGYGEEVDWCLRASRAGYRHVLAENLYVGHFHGGSFSSEEKKRLCDQHQKIIDRRYPEFMPALEVFTHVNDGILMLYRVSALMRLLKNRNIPLFMILDHSWGGGATHFILRRIKKLTADGQIVCRCRPSGFRNILAEIYCGGDVMTFNIDSLSFFFGPDSPRVTKMEINSIAGWQVISGRYNVSTGFLQDFFSQIAQLKQKSGISITYYMHDFLPICPFFNLVDNITRTYCGPDVKGEKCQECQLRVHRTIGGQPLPGCDIHLWRKLFRDFLSTQVNRIICFSVNTVEILQKIWDDPEFLNNISIQPHEALSNFKPVPVKPPVRPVVGVIGTLTSIKGAEIVLEFARMIEQKNLPVSLVIIGESPEVKFPRSVKVHGPYQHDDQPELIAKYGINIAWIASIWPETFSFVRQELCQMNIPTVCFDLGAPRDYIKEWDRGAIIPDISVQSVYDTISELYQKIYHRNPDGSFRPLPEKTGIDA